MARIVNRSGWPTAALDIIGTWILKRQAVRWDYTFTFRGSRIRYSDPNCVGRTWYGRGWRNGCTIMLPRRYLRPKAHNPWGVYDKSETVVARSRLELLVFLMAHEVCHAAAGNRSQFRDPTTGRVDHKDMERFCDLTAAQTVLALRDEWPALCSKIVERMRAEREERKRKRNPLLKIERMLSRKQRLVEKWETTVKRAAAKLAQYRKEVRYYEKRQEMMKSKVQERKNKKEVV